MGVSGFCPKIVFLVYGYRLVWRACSEEQAFLLLSDVVFVLKFGFLLEFLLVFEIQQAEVEAIANKKT